jgi:flagellar biosynthesis/type III secretory pathway M-ring protein FliF/YscJ
MDNLDTIIWLVKAVVVGLVILSVFIFVLCPLLRSQSLASRNERSPTRNERRQLEEEELEIPTAGPQGLSHQQIVKLARNDPQKTALMVRNWLQEKKQKPV